jgi:hypothetical protein
MQETFKSLITFCNVSKNESYVFCNFVKYYTTILPIPFFCQNVLAFQSCPLYAQIWTLPEKAVFLIFFIDDAKNKLIFNAMNHLFAL